MERLGKKFKLWLVRLFASQSTLHVERDERYLLIIVNQLLACSETELLMVPDMTKFYLKKGRQDDENGILVIIDFASSAAKIINHKFGYDIKMGNRVTKHIMTNFIKVVEERRNSMENDYMNNVQHSLSNVLDNVQCTMKKKQQDIEPKNESNE